MENNDYEDLIKLPESIDDEGLMRFVIRGDSELLFLDTLLTETFWNRIAVV